MNKNHNLLHSIIEGTTDAVFSKDLQGRYVMINSAGARFIGKPVEEIIGTGDMELFSPDTAQKIIELDRDIMATGEIKTVEEIVTSNDITWTYLVTKFPYCDQNGNIIGLIGIAHDITERKKMEELLRESEERYRTVFKQAADSVVVIDADTGEIVEFNDLAHKNLGYTRDEFKKLKIADIDIIESHEDVIRHLEKIMKKGGDAFETKHVAKNGEIRDMLISLRVISVRGKKLISGIWCDITVRKQIEKKINDLAKFPSENPNPILRISKDGRILFVNNAGLPLLNFWGSQIGKILSGHWHQFVLNVLSSNSSKNTEIEYDDRVFSLTFAPIIEEGYVNIYGMDITERKKAEENIKTINESLEKLVFERTKELKENNVKLIKEITERKQTEISLQNSEEKYRSLIEATTSIIWTTNGSGGFVVPQPSWEKYTGQPWSEHKDLGWTKKIHPDDIEHILKAWEIARLEMSLYETWGRVWNANLKEWRDFEVRAVPIMNQDGSLREWVGIITDITERKKAEEKLRLQSEITKNMAEGVYLVGLEDIIIIYANPKFEKMFGYNAGEMNGKHASIVNAPTEKDPKQTAREIVEVLKKTGEWHGEVNNIKKDGTSFWCYANVSVFDHPEYGKILISVHTDITERKQMEEKLKKLNESLEQLVVERTAELSKSNEKLKTEIINRKQAEESLLQSEKMNALGIMTSGVAHEFNNILGIISGNAQLMEEKYRDDEELVKSLRTICRVSDDGANIVDRMYKFTNVGKDTAGFIPVDLSDLIKQAVDFTMPRWQYMAQANGINYYVDMEDLREVPAVFGNPSELREVFVNIINNALDAMLIGGRLSFSTWRKDNTVFVSISDTGRGMPEEVQKHIFDPFFTTKSPEGTGLGMSVTYGIITRHDGKIDVKSKVGNGSTFTLRFPISKEAGHPDISSKPSQEIKTRSLNILVVDDEEEMCEVLSDFFTGEGHKVKSANNGTDGISLLKREDFDLLLCDLAMPNVTGRDVIKELDTLDKRPKVGLVTGWRYEMEDVKKEDLKVDFVVKKPFKFSELRRVIRNIFSNG